ncbi:MAG: hypothetical protein ACTSVZ_12375 [Promethearchaeota archaeon]
MKIIPCGLGLGHTDKVRVLCFDDSSKNVFSAGWDRTILKWQIPTFQLNLPNLPNPPIFQPPLAVTNFVAALPVLKFIGHSASISALVFWESQRILISGDKLGFIFFWNPENGELLAKIPTPHPKITALFIDTAQDLIYSGGSDGIIRTWWFNGDNSDISMENFPTLNLFREYHGPKHSIHVIRVDPLKKMVIASGDESNIYFWQRDDPDHSLLKHTSEKTIFSFDIDPNQSLLIGGGQKKKFQIVEYSIPTQRHSLITKAPISHILYLQTRNLWIAFDFNASIYLLEKYSITSVLDDVLGVDSMVFPAFDLTEEILVLSADTDEGYSLRFYWVKW